MTPFSHSPWTSLALLAPLALSLACNRPSKPVAHVAEQWVDQTEWRQYLVNVPKGAALPATLNTLVRREVAWEQAKRTGLLQSEGWMSVAPKIRRAILVRAYLDSLPGKAPATEDELRSFYLSHNDERHVVHVLAMTKAGAETAKKRLASGEPFDKVAGAMSIDLSAARNHGDLGWIKRGSVVPEFGAAVFAAEEGVLIGPFQSKFGWHVAQVKEKRSATIQDFEKNRGQLLDEAHDLVNAPKRAQALKALKDQYPLETDQTVLGLDQTLEAAPGDVRRIAGKVAGVSISLLELKAFIAEAMAGGQAHSLSAAAKQRFLEILSEDVRLAAAAEKAGLDRRPDIQAILWQTMRTAVYNGFATNYLRNLPLSEQDLATHLHQYPDRFRSVGAVKVYLLVGNDPSAMAQCAAEARNGAPWKQLIGKYANLPSTGEWNPGFLEAAALERVLPPEAVKSLLTSPLDSVLGPIPTPEGPIIFKVLERRPGAALPLAQCQEAVRQDLLNSRGQELLEKYLDGEGRKGIPVKVYPENARL